MGLFQSRPPHLVLEIFPTFVGFGFHGDHVTRLRTKYINTAATDPIPQCWFIPKNGPVCDNGSVVIGLGNKVFSVARFSTSEQALHLTF